MAFTRRQAPVVQSFGNSASARSLAYGADVTAGDLLVLAAPTYYTATWTVEDTVSSVWNEIGTVESDGYGNSIRLWYAIAGGTGPCTVTVTPNTSIYITMILHDYIGVDTEAPVRDHNHNNSGTSSSLTPTTAAVTAGATDLVLAAIGWAGHPESFVADSPFVDQGQDLWGTADQAGATADDLNAAGGSESASWVSDVALVYECKIAAFRLGGAPPPPLVAGTASLVSSGPAGIVMTATDATDGVPPYVPQWKRSVDGGSYSDLTNGGGVSGATTLDLTDGSATNSAAVYRYKVLYTDDATDTVESNVVVAQVYSGGLIGGGGFRRITMDGGF